MDPLLLLSPLGTETAPVASPVTTPVANPTPIRPTALNHPPYAEMITAAVSVLNDRTGSSKRAIAKYIEGHYTNLPPTHSSLLSHHLKRLKLNGKLVMVKNSYKLPRSVPASAANGDPAPVTSDLAAAVPKRRPGRPPKAKTGEPVQAAVPGESVQAAVPVFAVGPVNGPAPPSGARRGRGRPPKQGGGVKMGPGRPPKSAAPPKSDAPVVGVGKGRGRPKKNANTPPVAQAKAPGRPRGRPPKPINVFQGEAPPVAAPAAPVAGGGGELPSVGGAAPPVAVKRRGRPPKVGGEAKKPRVESKTPRKLSGKPLGRPKKVASAVVAQNPNPDSQLLVAYLDLKGKHDNLKATIKRAADVIKPFLNSEVGVGALEELERLASVDINAPSNVQFQQPQPQQQPES
ncbi:hypothetical protein ACJIZ3_004527 [Penstemon smallii]|uniref:H15 domain-containing protein n=1 Tax=Penstemon smallii TaxID=265156 RepID=A0ABD3S2D6_9LAMI